MNIRDHSERLREMVAQLESEVRMIIGSAGQRGGMYDSAVLALHHLEESRKHLGSVIQNHDGGVSAYDPNALPAPAGSETHPLGKTDEGEVAPPYVRPDAPSPAGPPVQPAPVPPAFQPPATVPAPMAVPQTAAVAPGMDAPPVPGQSSPAPAEAVHDPVTMSPHNDEDMAIEGEDFDRDRLEPDLKDKPEAHSVAHSDEPLPSPHQEDKEADVD